MVIQAANASGFVRVQPLQSRVQFYKVSTLATTFLLSVVLGNVALRYIPVSFSQVQPFLLFDTSCNPPPEPQIKYPPQTFSTIL